MLKIIQTYDSFIHIPFLSCRESFKTTSKRSFINVDNEPRFKQLDNQPASHHSSDNKLKRRKVLADSDNPTFTGPLVTQRLCLNAENKNLLCEIVNSSSLDNKQNNRIDTTDWSKVATLFNEKLQFYPKATFQQLKNCYNKLKQSSNNIVTLSEHTAGSTSEDNTDVNSIPPLCVTTSSSTSSAINNKNDSTNNSISSSSNSDNNNSNNKYSLDEIMAVQFTSIDALQKVNFTEDEDTILKNIITGKKYNITSGKTIDWINVLKVFQYECKSAFLQDTTKKFYDRQCKKQLNERYKRLQEKNKQANQKIEKQRSIESIFDKAS